LAEADPDKRFDKLLKIVRQEVFLAMAWDRIRTNKGSRTPGVDGQTKDDTDTKTIHDLAQELAERRYQPQPVRRVYIPKGRNQRRGLGIPTIRDRIVQAAVAQVLEAIYEPIFRNCSYGFRPGRSTIHALRHIARAYRAGATWAIEGDLAKCFDSLPHRVILNCLRKRIKDERFIDLIRQMLQAGVMEDCHYERTYSGAPQGGLCSPILMNIVLHEFDCWMEEHWQANPLPFTPKQKRERGNPEYNRMQCRLYRWRAQLNGRIPIGRQTKKELKRKIKETIAERKRTPCLLPRQAIYYCRYADDYVVVLCNYSKEDARCLKQAMAEWLKEELGLVQHPDKTQITHWSKRFRFLGYDLKGQHNLNGTHWLRLTIPPEAEQKLKQKVKRQCGFTQIPATDLFASVNSLLRGWTQYYRYAHNASQRFGYLTGVVYWLTAHYLGRKYRCSIRKLMRTHYGVDPRTERRALYIMQPSGKLLFIWNKPPKRRSVLMGSVSAQDTRPVTRTDWARGRSYEQKLELRERNDNRCQGCGETDIQLEVHHPNRLSKRSRHKKGPGNIIQSAREQQAKLLCRDCHQQHHPKGWRDAGTA
jgi:RNA-directed DNA polymerase